MVKVQDLIFSEYTSDLQLQRYFTDEYFTWQYLDLDPPRRWQNGRRDSLSISQTLPVRIEQTVSYKPEPGKTSGVNLQTAARAISDGGLQNVHQANKQAMELHPYVHKINLKKRMCWGML